MRNNSGFSMVNCTTTMMYVWQWTTEHWFSLSPLVPVCKVVNDSWLAGYCRILYCGICSLGCSVVHLFRSRHSSYDVLAPSWYLHFDLFLQSVETSSKVMTVWSLAQGKAINHTMTPADNSGVLVSHVEHWPVSILPIWFECCSLWHISLRSVQL